MKLPRRTNSNDLGDNENDNDNDTAARVEVATLEFVVPSSSNTNTTTNNANRNRNRNNDTTNNDNNNSNSLAIMESAAGTEVVLAATDGTVLEIIMEQQETTYISGVVHLTRLSELVGVSEQEVISNLQQQQQQQQQPHDNASDSGNAQETPHTENKKNNYGTLTETDPLIHRSQSIPESGDGDGDDDDTTKSIRLPADPFLASLTEVLPTVSEHGSVPDVPRRSSTIWRDRTASDNNDQSNQNNNDYLHDAFLIDVPAESSSNHYCLENGNHSSNDGHHHHHHHHYVLALPEIHGDQASVPGSDLSDEEIIMNWNMRLPSDVEDVYLEATQDTDHPRVEYTDVHLDVIVKRKVPIIGYLILLLALVSLAAVGTAFHLQGPGPTPFMKTLWRQTATCLVLLPFVLHSLFRNGCNAALLLTIRDILLLPLAAAAYTYMTSSFVVALDWTTLANALIFCNMTSLNIIVGRFVAGLPVLCAEGAGATIGFVGAAIAAGASTTTTTASSHGTISSSSLIDASNNGDDSGSMFGNLVALSSSFGAAGYLLIAKSLRAKMDLFLFMFLVMGIGSLWLLLFLLTSGAEVTFDRDPNHGVFGWVNFQWDRLPIELFLAIVCNCLGTMGYVAVMKYFDPVVPATTMLLEPAVGALLGVAAGTASMPGWQTWMGDLVVAAGTFLVIRAGASTTENIDATEVLRPRVDAVDPDAKSVFSKGSSSIRSIQRQQQRKGNNGK